MALLALGVTAGAYLEYRRLFGREVGVTLLVAMLCLKVLEMKMKELILVISPASASYEPDFIVKIREMLSDGVMRNQVETKTPTPNEPSSSAVDGELQ